MVPKSNHPYLDKIDAERFERRQCNHREAEGAKIGVMWSQTKGLLEPPKVGRGKE